MGPAELHGRRLALHLSQADFGRLLGVPRNTIARWERGEIEMRHSDLVGYALERIEAQAARPDTRRNGTSATNLPAEVHSFVGREHELAEIKHVLENTRLLTLSGTGGVGKTRLALRLAHEVVRDYRDGVWFIDLAPLSDPLLVARTVEEAVQPAMTSLASLAQRSTLLVMDNCEHLLGSCAEFIANLLRSGPAVRVVATSRESLELTFETVFSVQPLPTLAPCSSVSDEQLLEFSSRQAASEPCRNPGRTDRCSKSGAGTGRNLLAAGWSAARARVGSRSTNSPWTDAAGRPT
jgi:hypothetical protein